MTASVNLNGSYDLSFEVDGCGLECGHFITPSVFAPFCSFNCREEYFSSIGGGDLRGKVDHIEFDHRKEKYVWIDREGNVVPS